MKKLYKVRKDGKPLYEDIALIRNVSGVKDSEEIYLNLYEEKYSKNLSITFPNSIAGLVTELYYTFDISQRTSRPALFIEGCLTFNKEDKTVVKDFYRALGTSIPAKLGIHMKLRSVINS